MNLEHAHIVYQSKFKAQEITAVEALLRVDGCLDIQDYVKNYRNPVELDSRVIELVQQDLVSQQLVIPVAINVSYHSLINDEFQQQAIDMLSGYEVTLELTEHFEIEDIAALQASIEAFRAHNIAISLDNFGYDLSKAHLLEHLKFNEVKIDKRIVDGIDSDFCSYKHLAFIANKLRQFGVCNVVYKGVERQTQIDLIALFDPNAFIQGYYYSHPISIAQLSDSNVSIAREKAPPCIGEENIEKLVYDMALSQDKVSINDKIQQLDSIGTIYHEDYRQTLANFSDVYYRKNDIAINSILKIIDSSSNLVVIRNASGRVIYDNQAHQDLMGMSLVGLNPEDITQIFPDYERCLIDDKELISSTQFFSIKRECFDKDNYKVIRQKSRQNDQCFVIVSIYKEEHGGSYSTDTLTGCMLRDYLTRSDIKMKFRDKVVAFIDLNGFKFINDSKGHEFGDDCLVEFVNIFKLNLRYTHSNDVLIRYGGDEFVVLFDSSDTEAINNKLENINAKISRYFEHKELKLSFSFGTVLNDIDDINGSIKIADDVMYENKKQFYNKKQPIEVL